MAAGQFSANTIREWVDSGSFSRGQQYYRQEAIFNTRQEEGVLKAACYGSSPEPYRLWARLDGAEIVEADCTCPVGAGGHCKHMVALLLTWLHIPEQFREVQPLEKALQSRDKEDLILLIRQMVARYPDLEELVEATPALSEGELREADIQRLRRRLHGAIERGDFGHAYRGATETIAGEAKAILQLATQYKERGQWGTAAQITCVVLDELVEQYAQIYDDDGGLSMVFWHGGKIMEQALSHLQESEQRKPILQTLVRIVDLDILMGGYGLGDAVYDALIELTTPEEKEELRGMVESRLAEAEQQEQRYTNWRLQAYGRWLLNLHPENVSDEHFIAIGRRSQLHGPLVDRLLKLGRVEEAIAQAQQVSDYELLALADLFVAHDLGETAEQLVWERTGRSNDPRLDNWLKDSAIRDGDLETALKYAESGFWRRPSLEQYNEMRSIAARMHQEEELYQKVVTRLAASEWIDLLIRIHILHNKIEDALAAYATFRSTTRYGWGYSAGVDIELARAAEESHPQEAIRLYAQSAEKLIAQRGRPNYALAAGYLKRVRSLYERLGRQEQWREYIDKVRNQTPRLPAMLDEFKQAGL